MTLLTFQSCQEVWLVREPKQFLQEHYRKLLVVAALPILVVLVSSQLFNPSLLLSQCNIAHFR